MKINAYCKDVLYWIMGSLIYSVAVVSLLTPNKISVGGFTGVAAAVNSLTGLPVGTVLFLMNIPLFTVAFKKFGGGFILKTAAATLILSVFLNIAEAYAPKYTVNSVLASVFGGIAAGFGLSLIILRGATTGGTDVIALIINGKKPHYSIGRIIMLFDFAVIVLTAFVYKNIESALYSIITIYASSQITDAVIYGADKGKTLFIVSSYGKEIAERIGAEFKRGVTLIPATGGFTGAKNQMLFVAVRKHEAAMLLRLVMQIDSNAFAVVADAGEIIGEGFKKY